MCEEGGGLEGTVASAQGDSVCLVYTALQSYLFSGSHRHHQISPYLPAPGEEPWATNCKFLSALCFHSQLVFVFLQYVHDTFHCLFASLWCSEKCCSCLLILPGFVQRLPVQAPPDRRLISRQVLSPTPFRGEFNRQCGFINWWRHLSLQY
jgi:hypothetical protein